MRDKISFIKMVAAGNDFIAVEIRPTLNLKLLARRMCDRKFGVGADGILLLEKSRVADVKMRIFNADGSEAEMCGNGARCVSLWLKSKISAEISAGGGGFACGEEFAFGKKNQKSKILKIETKAGIIEAEVNKDNVKIKLTEPKNIKLDIPIKIGLRALRVNFINTGVPHAIVFVEGLDKIDVVSLGRYIRNHKLFAPKGTNVDFVEIQDKEAIKIRTYERGLEAETLACGTGAAAASLISNIKYQISKFAKSCKINVYTKSGEMLSVYFEKIGDDFRNVWLEGKAKMVYTGVYNLQ